MHGYSILTGGIWWPEGVSVTLHVYRAGRGVGGRKQKLRLAPRGGCRKGCPSAQLGERFCIVNLNTYNAKFH